MFQSFVELYTNFEETRVYVVLIIPSLYKTVLSSILIALLYIPTFCFVTSYIVTPRNRKQSAKKPI